MSHKQAMKYASQALHKFYNTPFNVCIHTFTQLDSCPSASPFLHERHGYCYSQKLFLVNVRFKWVKDRRLDHAVEREKYLKAVMALKDIVKKEPGACLPISSVSKKNRELGLKIRVSTFLRKYPTIFEEYVGEKYNLPWFRLTKEALELEAEEQRIHEEQEADAAERLCKLLMMTQQKKLPLQLIDHLKWDLGLPDNYVQSLVPNYPDYFSIVNMPDNNPGLDLVCWSDEFAVSALKKGAMNSGEFKKGMPLAFPMNYPKGYGVKQKVQKWIDEWQSLPYISPYEDASHLNPNSDLSEKRVVGVLHELLHLTVHKKAERHNLINLREQLGLPHKFAKCFLRHPGIFYLSMKTGTVTVVLREGYKRDQLIQKHPLMSLREKYIHLMKMGIINRRKGLYKKGSSKEQESKDCKLDQGLQNNDDSDEHSYEGEESQDESISTEEDSDDARCDDSDFSESSDVDDDEDEESLQSSQEDNEVVVERGVRTSGKQSSNLKTSGGRDHIFKTSARLSGNLKKSGRHGSNFETPEREASNLKPFVKRGGNFKTPERRGSKVKASGRQGSKLKMPGRDVSNLETPGSQGRNFKASGRQARNLNISGRQGSNLDTFGRQGSNLKTLGRPASDCRVTKYA